MGGCAASAAACAAVMAEAVETPARLPRAAPPCPPGMKVMLPAAENGCCACRWCCCRASSSLVDVETAALDAVVEGGFTVAKLGVPEAKPCALLPLTIVPANRCFCDAARDAAREEEGAPRLLRVAFFFEGIGGGRGRARAGRLQEAVGE